MSMGGEQGESFRFLLFGKTGNGKSATGNTILGEEKFSADLSLASVTSDCEMQRSKRAGALIQIMDSPGLYDTTKTQEEVCTVIVKAVACMHPGPDAVLYVVKLGRYTSEEYGVYNRLVSLFDEEIKKYIILVLTFGDALEKSKKTLKDLIKTAPKEFGQLTQEYGQRTIIFNNVTSTPAPQVESLLNMVRKLKRQNGVPYSCTRYKMIEETLKQEVAKRLALVDEKELGKMKLVQDLKKDVQRSEKLLKEAKEKAAVKEAEQEAERLARSLAQLKKLEEESRQRYDTEMRNMQDRIARNEEPGFVDKALSLIAKPFKAAFNWIADTFF